MGRVFDEEKHAILHKWLLLSDPEDPTSSAKGYVKVCVAIIGPGDEPPVALERILANFVYGHCTSFTVYVKRNNIRVLQGPNLKCTRLRQNFKVPLSESAEDNIEANLLRPAGVMLRPAVFVVRIYKAEELPRSTRRVATLY